MARRPMPDELVPEQLEALIAERPMFDGPLPEQLEALSALRPMPESLEPKEFVALVAFTPVPERHAPQQLIAIVAFKAVTASLKPVQFSARCASMPLPVVPEALLRPQQLVAFCAESPVPVSLSPMQLLAVVAERPAAPPTPTPREFAALKALIAVLPQVFATESVTVLALKPTPPAVRTSQCSMTLESCPGAMPFKLTPETDTPEMRTFFSCTVRPEKPIPF